MFQTFRPATRAVAAAALLSGLVAALPALAQSSSGTAPASPGATAAAPAAAPANRAEKRSARIEAHIADLKKQLQITDAQSQQWDAFAQVMRDNGEAMEAAIQEREASKGISAVQDLQSYAKIAQTHADGAQKLAAAFQPLYDSLSPEQKKNADTFFAETRHGRPHHHGGKAKKS